MDDFPYPKMGRADMTRKGKGEWFWESGFNKHPINDLELIRDWNSARSIGAFNAMKNRDGKAEHLNAKLDWVAYVGGTRESRRIVGDVMLTHEDIITKKQFPDGCVPSTWSIDLHFAKQEFAKKFPDNPFISYAEHDRRIDREFGYPIPYRCLYSVNVSNMFMAGRTSVCHRPGPRHRARDEDHRHDGRGRWQGRRRRRAAQLHAPRRLRPLLVRDGSAPQAPRSRPPRHDNTVRRLRPRPAPLTTPAAAASPSSLANLKGVVSTTKPRSSPANGRPAPAWRTRRLDYAYARGAGNTATFEFTVPTDRPLRSALRHRPARKPRQQHRGHRAPVPTGRRASS
jgi:hypothetical protein